MGTPDFGAAILKELIKNNYVPVLVVTAPDKPMGRKKILIPSAVKQVCQRHGIAVSQPKKLKEIKEKIKTTNSNLIITAAFGQIIPENILNIPKLGTLNVHPSLLPRHRGPSPIQTAILLGEKVTGVSIFLMDKMIDHGPIIAQKKHKIPQNIYHKELEKELSLIGSYLLIKNLPKWIKGQIKPIPQEEEQATYTKIIKKEDGRINWNNSAKQIEQQIRAFYPWPGSFTFWKNKILKITQAEPIKYPQSVPGKISSEKENKIIIQSKSSALVIKKLQLEGKNEMTAKEFILGHKEFIGSILK